MWIGFNGDTAMALCLLSTGPFDLCRLAAVAPLSLPFYLLLNAVPAVL